MNAARAIAVVTLCAASGALAAGCGDGGASTATTATVPTGRLGATTAATALPVTVPPVAVRLTVGTPQKVTFTVQCVSGPRTVIGMSVVNRAPELKALMDAPAYVWVCGGVDKATASFTVKALAPVTNGWVTLNVTTKDASKRTSFPVDAS